MDPYFEWQHKMDLAFHGFAASAKLSIRFVCMFCVLKIYASCWKLSVHEPVANSPPTTSNDRYETFEDATTGTHPLASLPTLSMEIDQDKMVRFVSQAHLTCGSVGRNTSLHA